MNTPIASFIDSYAKKGTLRLHMPGHKGKGPTGTEYADITEIKGADVLSEAKGIIGESEKNAAEIFMTGATYYSTEGSSLSIKAMLAAVLNGRNGNRRIVAARNVHKSFVFAAALLQFDVEWIYPEGNEHLCSCLVAPERLQTVLSAESELPAAVYVTSPDYLGNMQDIKGLAEVCRKFSVPLLVDNAHGAYTAFLESSMHPIALGASMCCDSAHKTLPVLTGGAYLHVSKDFDVRPEIIRNSLSLFGSTSPSYLILRSLDLCNEYLADRYRNELAGCVRCVDELRCSLDRAGWRTVGTEPLKITIDCAASGISGNSIADRLREQNIEPEFSDKNYVVMMFSPQVPADGYGKVSAAFGAAPDNAAAELPADRLSPSEPALSIRDAILGQQVTVPVAEAVGCICGTPVVSCPPAVPVVISGEIITGKAAEVLRHCGINEISIVKV